MNVIYKVTTTIIVNIRLNLQLVARCRARSIDETKKVLAPSDRQSGQVEEVKPALELLGQSYGRPGTGLHVLDADPDVVDRGGHELRLVAVQFDLVNRMRPTVSRQKLHRHWATVAPRSRVGGRNYYGFRMVRVYAG